VIRGSIGCPVNASLGLGIVTGVIAPVVSWMLVTVPASAEPTYTFVALAASHRGWSGTGKVRTTEPLTRSISSTVPDRPQATKRRLCSLRAAKP
jgi:hypothetical protein